MSGTAYVNPIPTREQHEAATRARLTSYTYDEVVAAIIEANETNAQYAALVDELYAPFDGWKWYERIADERYSAIAAITSNAYQVGTKGAKTHSNENWPLSRITKDTRALRRQISKLEKLAAVLE